MTMRNPLIDAEIGKALPIAKTFDPAKSYRYTWPGQPPKTINGAELTELCRGADASMLAIEEVGAATTHEIAPPADEHARPTFSSRPPFSRDNDR